jgi:hypothetical protein
MESRAGYFEEVGVFGVVANKQTYLNLAYLLLSFPLGIFYFVTVVTGLSLGFGLLIVWVGLLILLGLLVFVRALGGWERQLGIWFLGAHIPPPAPIAETMNRPLHALKKFVTDGYTYRILAYFLLKFPLAIASFVITVFLASFTMALLTAPLVYHFVAVNLFYWQIVRMEEAWFCLALGLMMVLLSAHIINGMGALCRVFVTAMLSGPEVRGEVPASKRIVIE